MRKEKKKKNVKIISRRDFIKSTAVVSAERRSICVEEAHLQFSDYSVMQI